MRRSLALAFLLLALLAAACTCEHDGHVGFGPKCSEDELAEDEAEAAGDGSGVLHVSNSQAGSLVRFVGVSTLDGDVASTTPVQGALTMLGNPRFLTLDASQDLLWVPNAAGNSVLVFEGASGLVGNVPPPRRLEGAGTGLSSPEHVQVDAANDRLFVSNAGASNLLVFENASTLDGEIAPTRIVGGANTGLVGQQGILLEPGNDRLYVANAGSASVLVFEGAGTLEGNPFPNRRLTGPNTGLVQPVALAIDSSDNLYVADAGRNAILRFANASTVDGDTAPAAVIEGAATELNGPRQILLSGGGLYVANSGANSILFFSDIASAVAAPFPDRRITGVNTNLSGPVGIALDP